MWSAPQSRRPKTCTSADHCGAANGSGLFDRAVGSGEQREHDSDAERLLRHRITADPLLNPTVSGVADEVDRGADLLDMHGVASEN
jgi:hypothetical protein